MLLLLFSYCLGGKIGRISEAVLEAVVGGVDSTSTSEKKEKEGLTKMSLMGIVILNEETNKVKLLSNTK